MAICVFLTGQDALFSGRAYALELARADGRHHLYDGLFPVPLCGGLPVQAVEAVGKRQTLGKGASHRAAGCGTNLRGGCEQHGHCRSA